MAFSEMELQGFCCPESLHAFLETKHFHSSFGPGVIFLLKKWKITLPVAKKNNFSWTNLETKVLLKPKEGKEVRGSKYLLYINAECFFWLAFYLVVPKNS